MDWLLQTRLFQRFWAIAGAASVRVKVLGIVVGVIVLLGVFVIIQIQDVLSNTLESRIREQSSALAHDISDQIMRIRGMGMQNSIDDFLKEWKTHYSNAGHNTHVIYLVIENADGAVIAGALDGDIRLDEIPPESELPEDGTILVRSTESVIEAVQRIPESQQYLRLALSRGSIQETVNQVSFQLFETTLVMIAVGFAAAFFLTWILTRPIIDLVQATQAVARGDFSRRVPRWASDEIGVLADAFNDMTASLEKAEQERSEREALRERYVSGVIVAQENERQRIARELHDSTGQSLTSILVGLQNLRHLEEEDKRENYIEHLRQTVLKTIDEVRTMAWTLRPIALDDLGLVSALGRYIGDYERQNNISVDITVNGIKERLPHDLEAAIYRIIQEGLTNITRHARAENVSIIMTRRTGDEADVIRIIIEDDGIGFDADQVNKAQKSLGLQGIRERAALFGGKLTIESSAGSGTSLYVEIPYTETVTGVS